MKSPIEQLDKLARYLIHNYGDMVRVDDMPNEDAVDEAIKILEQQRHLSIKCSGRGKALQKGRRQRFSSMPGNS